MKKFLLFSILVAGAAYWYSNSCCHKEELLRYPDDYIWGSSKPDTAIKPFTFKVGPKAVEDLKHRLASWRKHEPMQGQGHFYGISPALLEDLVKYWREKYDFSKFEGHINKVPHFKTVVNGLDLHFVHAKADPKATKKVPLLLVHGWPGSFVEFLSAIPLLTAPGPDGVAFDVVAPSIPGFGFSEAANKPGMSVLAVAQVFGNLMSRLGYTRYIYQGGDWGSSIGIMHARLFPDNVIGYHANLAKIPTSSLCEKLHLAAAIIAPELVVGKEDARKITKGNFTHLLLEETGYFHIQGTKPDTLGVALSDSPVGLLAWIGEKFELAVQHAEFKGDKTGVKTEDMFHNLNIYWFTNHITSAGRIYKEFFYHFKEIEAYSRTPVTVPSGITCYPKEFMCAPKALLKHSMPRLVYYTDASAGGHFAALEEPKVFVEDFRKAAAAFLAAHEADSQKPKA